MASELNHLQMVIPLILATIPLSTTYLLISSPLKRDSGKPSFKGSSQASALTATTILGGKPSRAPGSGLVGQPIQALFKKPFAPLTHDLPRQIEPGTNFVIGESLSGQKHYL